MRCVFRALIVLERLEGGAGRWLTENIILNNADPAALEGQLFSPQTHSTSLISPISLRLMTDSPVIKTEIDHYCIKCSNFSALSVH